VISVDLCQKSRLLDIKNLYQCVRAVSEEHISSFSCILLLSSTDFVFPETDCISGDMVKDSRERIKKAKESMHINKNRWLHLSPSPKNLKMTMLQKRNDTQMQQA
jgi:CRISPR/Cas system CMR-associated protein Cmr1 (group 7 of RAMP superfamily)